MSKGGFSLDLKASGAGLVPHGFHATAIYADPVTDNLYLVLSEVNEPTHVLLPVPSTAPTPDGVTIYQFNGDPASKMVYRWKSKLYLTPVPGCFFIAQVRAEAYANTVIRFMKQTYSSLTNTWSDVLIRELRVLNETEIRLPIGTDYTRFWWEVVSTDTLLQVQIAEGPEELS